MKTRAKNKSKHPAAPVMTPAQLAAAGISQPQKCPRRKQTKDQQIAALEEDLRTTRELLQASHPTPSQTAPSQMVLESPNEDDDTEPATEDDDYMFAGGRKRVSQKPAGAGKKLKRSRAMDPFESEMIHPGATGLIDNWRSKLTPTPSVSSSQSFMSHTATDPFESERIHSGATGLVDSWRSKLTPALSVSSSRSIASHTLVTPERQQSPISNSPMMIPIPLNMEDSRPVYKIPEIVKKQKVFPGIKDLPPHVRANFRNIFIRHVIRDIFDSERPWVNPDTPRLQLIYDKVYPTYPARLRHSDAIFHPTVTAVGVARNRIGTAALFAVQCHLANIFRQKRLQTLNARAKFVSEQFRSDDDHPFIWYQYTVSDIPNHPETGGYRITRRGVFQCEPILEALLVYYSSSGIMESPPTEDPGEGYRPIGALSMVTAAVECAYKMHLTGDYVEASESFNAEFWGPRTTLFMEYITKDLAQRHWDGIFRGLAAMSVKVAREAAAEKGAPQVPQERAPLPPSDPPSPPAAD